MKKLEITILEVAQAGTSMSMWNDLCSLAGDEKKLVQELIALQDAGYLDLLMRRSVDGWLSLGHNFSITPQGADRLKSLKQPAWRKAFSSVHAIVSAAVRKYLTEILCLGLATAVGYLLHLCLQ